MLQIVKKKPKWKVVKGKIQAVIGKKKYTCKVTVSAIQKTSSGGSRPVPTSGNQATPTLGAENTPDPTSESKPTTTPETGNTPAPTSGSKATPTPGAENTPDPTIPPNLKAITYDGTNIDEIRAATELVAVTIYDSRSDCNAIIEKATNTLLFGCKNTIIPEDVSSIGDAAFAGCSGLTQISIPNSVTKIEDSAFSGCSGLTSIIWKDNTYSTVDDFMNA